jgi:hypothetical protein
VTKKGEKMLRMQIIELLDQCEDCKYRFKAMHAFTFAQVV